MIKSGRGAGSGFANNSIQVKRIFAKKIQSHLRAGVDDEASAFAAIPRLRLGADAVLHGGGHLQVTALVVPARHGQSGVVNKHNC